MVKWIVVIIAVLGTSWAFKGTIKKIFWKFKNRKHNIVDPDCWYCKEQKRKERARK
ncbi:hypothetical protein [Spiroplasma endosymbiont of Apeira syringaria]|uniref:hypothetical protein n=1 Tax=Spiroplasma endosymbiont of Apeira syringaria TaxID=3066307 RepID=UPI0030D5D1A6